MKTIYFGYLPHIIATAACLSGQVSAQKALEATSYHAAAEKKQQLLAVVLARLLCEAYHQNPPQFNR